MPFAIIGDQRRPARSLALDFMQQSTKVSNGLFFVRSPFEIIQYTCPFSGVELLPWYVQVCRPLAIRMPFRGQAIAGFDLDAGCQIDQQVMCRVGDGSSDSYIFLVP